MSRSLYVLLFSIPVWAQTPTLVQWHGCPQTLNTPGGSSASAPTSYNCALPNPSQAGNAIVVYWTGDDSPGTITASDDQGNSYSLAQSEHDTTNQAFANIYVALNIAAGTRLVTLTFGSPYHKYNAAVVAEFDNVATSSAVDATSGNFGSSTTITAGSMTPGTSGDLLIQCATNDGSITVPSFTAGSQSNITWQRLASDPMNGTVCQFGVFNSTSAINPTLTQSASSNQSFDSVAVALRTASSGGTDSRSFRVLGIQDVLTNASVTPLCGNGGCSGTSSSTQTVDLAVPSGTNLTYIGWISGGGDDITSITSSPSCAWTSTGPFVQINPPGDTGVHGYYCASSSLTNGATVTMNFNHTLAASDNAVIWYVTGAAASPFDKDATATGQQTTGTSSLTTVSITPSTANGLVIVTEGESANYMVGLTGSNQLFDSSWYGNEAYRLTDPAAFSSNDNGWGHYYNPSASPVTFTFNVGDSTTCSGECAVNYWSARADSFVAAGGTTGPTGTGNGGTVAAGVCDLNSDGVVNVVDVQLAVNIDLGLLSCPVGLDGGVCGPTLVQQVLTAALGEGCSATISTIPVSHSVTLNWAASTSPNIAGYNVYRSTTSGGPYAQLNSSLVTTTSFIDSSVATGETYYYVTTTVDTSNDQSAYSNQAQATIPSS